MDLIKFNRVTKSWSQIAQNTESQIDSNFQLEIHKKLLDIFHVGDYYYYIFNPATAEMELISDSIVNVLKLKDKQEFSAKFMLENLHPDDLERFIKYEEKVTEFFRNLKPDKILKYKVSYDYRLKNADGNFIWILMQTTTIQTDENGAVLRVLGVQTDITHLKSDNQPSGLSFLGLEGEPSFYNVNIEFPTANLSQKIFTQREKEILTLILEGKKSIEIAQMLHISLHTVNSHRKNIFQKTNSKTISELAAECIRNNWI